MTQSEKVGNHGDEEIIKELCVCNGVSYEKISQDGRAVTALEMFFSGFPCMVGLSLFPRLITLTIVGQNIQRIQGLEECPLLKELWVAECQLSEMSGLQSCVQLQKLYLYDNKISEITELESLINLDVLWLNNNQISHIQGLHTLEKLTELNLADNFIETIGNSLEQNKDLQILNLSGNKISSFKELTHLRHLSKLKELGLKDSQSSPNPVCLLCNYSTHVLYHIPTLHRFDSYNVSPKIIKDAAELTVMKKMMYYKMRVHSVQRNFHQMELKLQQYKEKLQRLPEERIRALSYTLQHLQSESETVGRVLGYLREEVKSEEPADSGDSTFDLDDPGNKKKLEKKVELIRERIKIWERRIEQLEVWFQQEIAMATARREQMIHFLLMELETVGNIRFEEGSTNDAWFNTCYDLLLSRFCLREYKPHNITGIKINRIVRVQHRALRLRFEDKLHFLLVDHVSPLFIRNYKHNLEYLFYVFDPERSTETNEILDILENGFQSAKSYKIRGRERAVSLTNSLSLCEEPRIRSALRTVTTHQTKSSAAPLPFKHGQLIISKVFLGRSVPMKNGVPVDSAFYPKAHSVYHKPITKQCTASQGKPDAVCTSELQGFCDCGQKETQWFVFDHELVLPEYLIDFEYISQETSQLSYPSAPGCEVPEDITSKSFHDQTLDEEVLALEPFVKTRPKLLSLDEKSILTAARANVLSQITVLNLHGNSLSRLKEISHLSALRHLTISFNELTHLDEISHLPSLECVDASFNQIVTLDGVQGLPRLKQLDLRWNQLSLVKEDTVVLHKHTPSLLQLDTRYNPWSQGESRRMEMLGQLKSLTHLDGVLVSEDEAAASAELNTSSKITLASLLSHSRTDTDRPRCLSVFATAQVLTKLKSSPWKHLSDLEPGWSTKITALNLDGQRLYHISNLEKLVNLRWASFNHNQLTHINGLKHCLLLEELSLDHNNICTLEGVGKLHHLTRLSINSNRLRCLDGSVLDCLSNLHYLSAESNCITSLHGVQRSRVLLELYLGNNIISTSRDIYHLKNLSSLIILDLQGNPLAQKLENFRAFVIFHLPCLKALDGSSVDVAESENAKDLFGGRLTADMVAEKLGHSNYREIVDLELTDCTIRMVDLVPFDLFVNLRSVNLERNNLTSFSGIVYLPNIKVLRLNYNHIESILPRQKVQTHLNSRQQLYQKVHSSGYGQQSRTSRECVDVDGLEPLMSCLEVLHLSYNGISNLNELQLSRLTNLRALFLQGNEIGQLEGLDGLSHLQKLVLDQNRMKMLSESCFTSHTHLIELHINDNRLRSLPNLQLPQLQRLFLNNNKLQDLAELDKLETLPSLTELSVIGNPLARRSLHRPPVVLHLPHLQVLDGIPVTLEERTELLCTECPGSDMSFPGLLCRAPPVRGANLSVGLQQLVGPEILINTNTEDTHHKYKKQRVGVIYSRSAQGDKCRGALNLTGFLSNTSRLYITHTESDNRYQNSNGAKPPPL
ncbi:leucine-rich repeat-containing protein 9 isoform X2 [Trichomycterus rosablanca]|uniref:leucine-rich repeat-containing protein 9 isoform X2 n=1 Tax=Trichomycterus rosablanca TaxID=2290929 RepID=UPI002F351EC7